MLAAVLISSCASVVVSHRFDATPSVTKSQYDKSSGEMGTVVLAMNSNRYWGCGGYENAELQSMGFDLLPARHTNNDQAPEFVINGSSGGPDFMVYSSMLAPGTYALSYIKIKVARSMSEVAYLTAERSSLIQNHLPVAGTFNVQAGEVVYIGHFGLDCVNQPMLWRFYKEDKQSFKEFQDALNVYIPYLDDATFRLFETSHFGYDFSL
jgi:hypothetical protein